jgi:hypothetical protein
VLFDVSTGLRREELGFHSIFGALMWRQPRAGEACLDFVALTERDDAGQPFGPQDRAGPVPVADPGSHTWVDDDLVARLLERPWSDSARFTTLAPWPAD